MPIFVDTTVNTSMMKESWFTVLQVSSMLNRLLMVVPVMKISPTRILLGLIVDQLPDCEKKIITNNQLY